MTSLTTRQRDLLQFLLECEGPAVVSDIAEAMALTPRQVNYSLKGVRAWLMDKGVEMKITPGVGIEILSSAATQTEIQNELEALSDFHLVLSAGQRQQLFALNLLTTAEPLILFNLQQTGQVSRTTILKDLETLDSWLADFGLILERRPNYGIWISGSERAIRQALTALLWGDTFYEDPLWQMTHLSGLEFALEQDAQLLPILEEVVAFQERLKTKAMMHIVASAEANLGGRFSDQAVLYLALTIAVHADRMENGRFLQEAPSHVTWLRHHAVWRVAQKLFADLAQRVAPNYLNNEIDMLAILLLSCAKNDRWPGDLESDGRFPTLIDNMMATIGEAYELPELANDTTLRDGLIANILPACLRLQFRVWSPLSSESNLLTADKYAFENQLANHLTEEIYDAIGVTLTQYDIDNMALLLRAAYIRERPQKTRRIIVVCPSGMATAQLLVARLKARFPRLGTLNVVSMRELDLETVADAHLIITTVPLNRLRTPVPIIQVHPQLLPEDISRITQWMA